jgi:hypothetical protein
MVQSTGMSDRIVTVKLPMRQARKLFSLAQNGWDDVWIMDHCYSSTLGLRAIDKLRKAIKQKGGKV